MEYQYCRLCSKSINLCVMDSSIRNWIKNEYSIEIKDKDELSNEICRQCEKTVMKIIKFREEVEKFGDNVAKVQKKLRKILKKRNTGMDSNMKTAHRTQTEDVSQKNKFQCRYCCRGFPTLLLLEAHPCTMENSKNSDDVNRASCPSPIQSPLSAPSVTRSDTKAAKKIRKHLKKSEEKNQALASSPIQSPPTDTEKLAKKHAIDSVATSTSKKIKIIPKDIAHRRTFNCDNCCKAFPTMIELENHGQLCTTTLTGMVMKNPNKKLLKRK